MTTETPCTSYQEAEDVEACSDCGFDLDEHPCRFVPGEVDERYCEMCGDRRVDHVDLEGRHDVTLHIRITIGNASDEPEARQVFAAAIAEAADGALYDHGASWEYLPNTAGK